MPDNRQIILQTALELFAQKGYDAVGVQQIAEASAVTKPTLYHYFGSKRGLFEALVETKSQSFLQDVRQAAVYNHDITRSITEVVKVFFEFAAQHPTFYRMILAMWFAPPSSEYYLTISTLLNDLLLPIDAMFEAAEQDHGNMRGRHKRYAVTLRGLIDTYIGLSLHEQIQLDDDQLVYRLVHEFMHGIFS